LAVQQLLASTQLLITSRQTFSGKMPHHDYWRDEPDDSKNNETRMIKAIHKIHTHVGYNYPGCTMDELNKLHAQQNLDFSLS